MDEEEAISDVAGRIGSYAYLMFATDTAEARRAAPWCSGFRSSARRCPRSCSSPASSGARWTMRRRRPSSKSNRRAPAPGTPLEADRRFKQHTLSEPVEQALVEKDVTGSNAWARFTQLMGSLRYNLDGQRLTQSQVLSKFHEPDRDLRKRAATALTETLEGRKMELTYVFNVLAADKASEDRMRGYPNWISSRNLSNKARMRPSTRWCRPSPRTTICARRYRLKRRILGYDELYDYDRYAPIRLDAQGEFYTWEEARDITQGAYGRFSPRMGEAVALFFDKNWIHAPVQPNKQGGAFASPTVPSARPVRVRQLPGQGARHHDAGARARAWPAHVFRRARQWPVRVVHAADNRRDGLDLRRDADLQRSDGRQLRPAAQLELLLGKLEDSFATVFRQIAMNRFEDAMHTARRTGGRTRRPSASTRSGCRHSAISSATA